MEDKSLKISKFDLIKLVLRADGISGNAKTILMDMILESADGVSLFFNGTRASKVCGLCRQATYRLFDSLIMEGLIYDIKPQAHCKTARLNPFYFEDLLKDAGDMESLNLWNKTLDDIAKGEAQVLADATQVSQNVTQVSNPLTVSPVVKLVYDPKADTSYCDLNYLLPWRMWLDYKESIGEPYTNEMVAKVNCENLAQWACGKKYFAEAIVKKAISRGWKNFFALTEEEKDVILQNRTEEDRMTDLGYTYSNGDWYKNGMKKY